MNDPCLSCQYRLQACAYILDGEKHDDACLDKRMYLRQQKKPMATAPHHIYWKDAKPKDFINIRLDDWIEGVGHVSTPYEVRFTRGFGLSLSGYRGAEQSRDAVLLVLRKLENWVKKNEDEFPTVTYMELRREITKLRNQHNKKQEK